MFILFQIFDSSLCGDVFVCDGALSEININDANQYYVFNSLPSVLP